MSWRSRAWERIVIGPFSWAIVPLALVGIVAIVTIDAVKRRRSRKAKS